MAQSPIAARVAERMQSASFIREMFEKGLRLREQRGPERVLDFTLGNPNGIPPREYFDALVAVAAERDPVKHRYMPNAGFPETRAAVAGHLRAEYGWDIDADSVILTSGAAGGLNVALRAICDPGSEVLVIAPYFPEYEAYVEQAGGRTVVVQSDAAFQPDPAAIRAALSDRTRAIIVNSPNNPTGVVYSEAACRAIAEALAERDSDAQPMYLLLDDPYRRLVFEAGPPPSPGDYYARRILVASYSKDLSIPGERAGYIAVPATTPARQLLVSAMTMLNRTLGFVNMPAFMQRVIARCATGASDFTQYRRNRDALCDGLEAAGYELVRPGGAMFVFPRTPIEDDRRFTDLLMDEDILAVPGRGFGCPGHMRLSIAVEPDVIERAIPGFGRALERVRS